MKIITLTLNPAIDVHIRLSEMKLGCDNGAVIERKDNGGKGVNVSRALNAYGIDNICFTVLGRENGEGFVKELGATDITHKYIWTDGGIRENINIHSDTEDTVIATEGFSLSREKLLEVERELSEIADKGDILCFCGRIPKGIDKTQVVKMLLNLREKGVKLVLDSKSFELFEVISLKPYLIKPNEEELPLLTGRSSEDIDGVIKSARGVRDMGVENVLVTLGKDGGVLVSSDGVFVGSVPKIKVKSTVGAGDSTVAGFLSGAKLGLRSCECFKLALAFGSSACLAEGSLPPDPCQIKAMLRDIEITEK